MERGLVGLQENMTVQGVMMHRLGNGLDELRAIVAENSTAIAQNTEAIGQLAEAMARSAASTKTASPWTPAAACAGRR